MDKKYIEENEIEIKYLRNQLTEQELEEFEVYLMEHPEMVECLDLVETLSQGVKQHRELVPSVKKLFVNWRGILKLPQVNLPLTATFSVLFGAFIVSFMEPSNELPISEISSTQYIELVSVRGSSEDASVNTIVIDTSRSKQSPKNIALLLDTGVVGASEWTVELRDSNSDDDVAISNVTAQSNDDGYVLLSIPTSFIKQGVYTAKLIGDSTDLNRVYSFRIEEN